MEFDLVFHALADETRRRLIDVLAARDGQSLFELQVRMTQVQPRPLTRQGLSKHLAVLEKAGLLRIEWQSRSKLHFLCRKPLVTAWKLWLGPHVDAGLAEHKGPDLEDRRHEHSGR